MLGGDGPMVDDGLVNMCTFCLPEIVPDAVPEEIPDKHRATWQRAQQELQMFLSHEARDGDILAHIAWRIGREVGKVRRILSDSGISWGFFYDHDPNNPNNASVPDNFVIIPGER